MILDQGTKALVRSTLPLHESLTVVPGLLDFTHVRNSGAAFGILNAADFPFKTVLISVIAAAALIGIGFYSAALTHEDRSVPAHFVTVGGQTKGDEAQFGVLLGKFPAKNCVPVTKVLLELYQQEKSPVEDFNAFVDRAGTERLKLLLEPLREIPSFASDAGFYEDYGHEHERFAVQKGIKGECAGSTDKTRTRSRGRSSASSRADAAATLVLPTPPLPPNSTRRTDGAIG